MWVLTGDKQETAINIGLTSRLLTDETVQIIINADNVQACEAALKTVCCLCVRLCACVRACMYVCVYVCVMSERVAVCASYGDSG